MSINNSPYFLYYFPNIIQVIIYSFYSVRFMRLAVIHTFHYNAFFKKKKLSRASNQIRIFFLRIPSLSDVPFLSDKK